MQGYKCDICGATLDAEEKCDCRIEKRNVVAIRQLPIIEEHLRDVREEVERKVSFALSTVVTEESLKTVKEYRAELNREYKVYEDMRKAIKSAVMTPYNEFEATYKENVGNIFAMADATLKERIGEAEGVVKERKQEEAKGYFDTFSALNGVEWLDFGRSGIEVTMSKAPSKLKDEIHTYIYNIVDAVSAIKELNDADEVLYEYKSTLNLNAAINAVKMRHNALSECRAGSASAEEPAKEAEAPIEAPVAEPIMTIDLSFRGTKEQLKGLLKYAIEKGIDYNEI